jgi:mRNA-degrading endonuclease RelE of RelBE toxin-antitoxin system
MSIEELVEFCESEGMEFAPEDPKPGAVGEWDLLVARSYREFANQGEFRELGNAMRDELLAENKQLRAEIERLKTELDRTVNLSHGDVSGETYETALEEIERLKGNWKINCDMMETRNEIIKKQKAEIERLKQPILESPELVKAREEYQESQFISWRVSDYVVALEFEIERLRQRIGVLESGGGIRYEPDSATKI